MSTIAVFGSRRQNQYISQIEAFLGNVRAKGIDIVMHGKLYDHLAEIAPCAIIGVERRSSADAVCADLAVSLGGDGTFLRTAQWVGPLGVPIVGVNTGHLGYLAALSIDRLPELPDLIANDGFVVEHRTVLSVDSPQLPPSVGRYALNEVALSKEESASMIYASVCLDGEPLADYKADGLLVATSTGSTAYNLSVGGPIVQPTVPVWVLSPVAAHSLSMRPMVVDSRATIRIVPTGRSPHVRLAVDGRSVIIDTGTEIRLSKAPFELAVLQLRDHTFADTLRRKLHWAE